MELKVSKRGMLSPAHGVFFPEASVVIDGLKEPGPHCLRRVRLVDGQQQQKMTGEGLRQVQIVGVGQEGHRHLDALHARERNSVDACEEHWRSKRHE